MRSSFLGQVDILLPLWQRIKISFAYMYICLAKRILNVIVAPIVSSELFYRNLLDILIMLSVNALIFHLLCHISANNS